MNANVDTFEIQVKDGKAKVQRHDLSGTVIFRVIFPGTTPPLVLTHATRENGNKFWTSIPEGRLNEAARMGELITEHYKSNQ